MTARTVFIEITTRQPLSRILAAIERLPGIEKVSLEAENSARREPQKLLAPPKQDGGKQMPTGLIYDENGKVDIDKSLDALKIGRGDLMRKKWTRGSPQHRVKSAIVQQMRYKKAA
jgi:hypothetical protein